MRSATSDSRHVCLSCLLRISRQRASIPTGRQTQKQITHNPPTSKQINTLSAYDKPKHLDLEKSTADDYRLKEHRQSTISSGAYSGPFPPRRIAVFTKQSRDFHCGRSLFEQLENTPSSTIASRETNDLRALHAIRTKLQNGVSHHSDPETSPATGLTIEQALKVLPERIGTSRQKDVVKTISNASSGQPSTKVDHSLKTTTRHKKAASNDVADQSADKILHQPTTNVQTDESTIEIKRLRPHPRASRRSTQVGLHPRTRHVLDKQTRGTTPLAQGTKQQPEGSDTQTSIEAEHEQRVRVIQPRKPIVRADRSIRVQRQLASLRKSPSISARFVSARPRIHFIEGDSKQVSPKSRGPRVYGLRDSKQDRPEIIPDIDGFDLVTMNSRDLELKAISMPQPQVPKLSFDLSRVLFNPGVYQLQDPRSRVYNFDPYLAQLMPVAEFNFDALNKYVTSSEDNHLRDLGLEHGKKYVGSSSSMSAVLCHFHFLLSAFRPINLDLLSRSFKEESARFTKIQQTPAAMYLRWKDGVYGVDADKEYDSGNILMSLGKSMEKLLTLEKDEFERYRKTNTSDGSGIAKDVAPEAYHYSEQGDFLLRSQLDAHDPRLPGSGMFDLKTRAVAAVRMNIRNHERGVGYQIKERFGNWESYEREYYDMIRSAFLKYSIQVRMGRMDGIFVAYHNVERIFGFQYIPLPELDLTLHGQSDRMLGDAEFRFSIQLLNKLFDLAAKKFPEQSLQFHFETRESARGEPFPFMYVFAKPVTDEVIQKRQDQKKQEMDNFERRIFNPTPVPASDSSSSEVDQAMGDPEGELQSEYKTEVAQSASPTEVVGTAEVSNGPNAIDATTEVDQTLVDQTRARDGTNKLSIDEDVGSSPTPTVVPSELQSTIHEAATATQSEILQKSDTESETAKDSTSSDADSVRDLQDNTIPPASESTDPSENNELQARTSNAADVDLLDSLAGVLGDTLDDPGAADNMTSSPQPSSKEDDDLLGFKLYIRNKVNGKAVVRPSNTTDSDQWAIEYSIVEMQDGQARLMYTMCKNRRRTVLAERQDSDAAASFYLKRLEKISQEGATWRKQQDEMDKERDPIVLYGKKDISGH